MLGQTCEVHLWKSKEKWLMKIKETQLFYCVGRVSVNDITDIKLTKA